MLDNKLLKKYKIVQIWMNENYNFINKSYLNI